MQLLKNRIEKDAKILPGNVLKVSSFLNHQIDVSLLCEIGKEFKRRFEGSEITKILTIEASGIGIACVAAQYFNVPVVFAKKTPSKNISGDMLTSRVFSYTKGTHYDITVAKEFISPDDKILIIDDFLANGAALLGLSEIISLGGASLVGAGIVIEKAFQDGGKRLRKSGMRVESLARVSSMSVEGGVKFL